MRELSKGRGAWKRINWRAAALGGVIRVQLETEREPEDERAQHWRGRARPVFRVLGQRGSLSLLLVATADRPLVYERRRTLWLERGRRGALAVLRGWTYSTAPTLVATKQRSRARALGASPTSPGVPPPPTRILRGELRHHPWRRPRTLRSTHSSSRARCRDGTLLRALLTKFRASVPQGF